MRQVLRALAVAAAGLAPLAATRAPVALLVWLALAAPALGCASAVGGGRLLPALLAPLAWGLALLRFDLPGPAWAALGVLGLFLVGRGLGAGARGPAPAAALALACALLVGLPLRAGLGGEPWVRSSPALGVALFELSPATWLVESAGVDWMRAPGVYEAAGTEWFPAERRAVRGALAGPLLFVVGCAFALLGPRLARRRSASTRSTGWPSESTSAPSRST